MASRFKRSGITHGTPRDKVDTGLSGMASQVQRKLIPTNSAARRAAGIDQFRKVERKFFKRRGEPLSAPTTPPNFGVAFITSGVQVVRYGGLVTVDNVDMSISLGSGRVVGYVRCSTDSQMEKEGPHVQKKSILAFAALEGVKVDEWIEDAETGSNCEREGLVRLREMAVSGGVAAVFVFKLDRLSRNAMEGLMLKHELELAGARVVSVSEFMGEGAIGKLMTTVMFAFAELERDMIRARTSEGRRSAVTRRGTYLGGSGVFGYRSVGDGLLEVDQAEAEIVRRLFGLREADPRLSLSQIALMLGGWGYRTRMGAEFSAMAVKRILDRREFYAGRAVLNGSVGESETPAHQAII